MMVQLETIDAELAFFRLLVVRCAHLSCARPGKDGACAAPVSAARRSRAIPHSCSIGPPPDESGPPNRLMALRWSCFAASAILPCPCFASCSRPRSSGRSQPGSNRASITPCLAAVSTSGALPSRPERFTVPAAPRRCPAIVHPIACGDRSMPPTRRTPCANSSDARTDDGNTFLKSRCHYPFREYIPETGQEQRFSGMYSFFLPSQILQAMVPDGIAPCRAQTTRSDLSPADRPRRPQLPGQATAPEPCLPDFRGMTGAGGRTPCTVLPDPGR